MATQSAPMPDVSQLLLKEQEELNNWLRTSLQIYFTWYCVFLTVNGAGLAALLPPKLGEGPAYILFAFWNILGIVVSIFVFGYVNESHKRVNAICENLVRHNKHTLMPKSPIPAKTALGAIILDTAAMLSLFIAWTWLFWHVPKPTQSPNAAPAQSSRPAPTP
jgi:hypothetical protein